MAKFGEDFQNYDEASAEAAEEPKTATPAKALEAVDRSKAKKGKLNAKSTGLTYQFQILELLGVPKTEIKKFADPMHWLEHFTPLCQEDMNGIGARVDWRRQFLTSESIESIKFEGE
jgi:leucyl-tRNA synthetase